MKCKGPNKKTNKHIKLKLSAFVFISCIVLTALYAFVFLRVNSLLINSSSKNILEATESYSKTLSSNVKSDLILLENFSKSIGDSSNNLVHDNEKLSSFIKSKYDSLSFTYDDIIYIGTDKNTWSVSGKDIYVNEDDLKNIFENKSAKNNVVITYKDNIIAYSLVKVDGENLGVLVGVYSHKSLKNEGLKEVYGNEISSYIINSKGDMVLNPNSENLIYSLNFSNIFDITEEDQKSKDAYQNILIDLSNKDKGSETIYINDIPYFVSYSPITDINDWYSISIVPRSIMMVNMNYLLFSSILIGAFVILLIAIIGYGYAKSKVEHNEKIKNIAYNDHLTGYPNFSKFKIDADEILKKNKDTTYCLCYADMVGFKFVNEAFGYDVGDHILKEISKIFADILEEDEIFSRVSGDRFIVLKKLTFNDAKANEILFGIVDKISKISPLVTSRMRLEVHVGVYIIEPGNSLKINAMFDRAIIALESINRQDSCYAIYDEELRINQLEKNLIEQRMESSLRNGEFHVYIQPKYKTSDRTLAAGEALIRWHDPEKGVIPPIKFIPLFEKNRFIFNLDRYVLEVVCHFLRKRLDEKKDIVPISLNVSPVEILMPNFTQAYISIKQKYDIPDGIIELEFTEGVFFENQRLFKEVIIELKNAGFCCSLDDFGSGYSSLNVLKEMPVDVLKLDRMFFKESDDIIRDRSLIRSVVAMARSLKIKTVAEGVETLDTVEFLKIIGCNMIQGFIYARPMPINDFETLMNNETISDINDIFEDYDKISELLPVDKPYDLPLRNTYESIFEINVTSRTYHLYKQEDCQLDYDGIEEIGEYSNSKYRDAILSKIHKDDLENFISVCNSSNLISYFENKREMKFDFRALNKNGKYVWVRCRLLKAKDTGDNLVIFAYIKSVDDQKQIEDSNLTAETRLSTAFMGIAGMIFELDLTNGHLSLIKSYSENMKKTISGDNYEAIFNFASSYLVHPDFVEKFIKECSFVAIRNEFSQSPNKALLFEYLAKSSRDNNTYSWYSIRYSYTPELSDKVLISLQDISKRKYADGKNDIKEKLISLANKHIYDEIIEINLTNDTYELTKVTDDGSKADNLTTGKYSEFFKSSFSNQFLKDDIEFFTQIMSNDGLLDMYNDSNVSDFTVNLKRKVFDGSYQWHSFYIIPNRTDPYFPDSLIFIFINNIEQEKDIHDRLSTSERRLISVTSLFELSYELDIKSGKAMIFGGTNIPSGIFIDKQIEYEKLVGSIGENLIHESDLDYFKKSMSLSSLKKQFKDGKKTVSLFIRSKFDDVKWISINNIYDSRNNIASVFIQNLNNKNFSN